MKSAAKSVVTKYYTALAAEDYQGAYNLLTKISQEYYGTLDNYISTFTVTGMDIKDYKIYRVKTADTAIVTKTMVNYSMAGALFAEAGRGYYVIQRRSDKRKRKLEN